MSEDKYTLTVHNLFSEQSKVVVVTEAVYNEYRRGIWRMKSSDRNFRKYTIAFSELSGECDCFHEFCSNDSDPARLAERQLLQQDLLQAMALLPENDRALLRAIFEEGTPEREIAAQFGVSQKVISRRKQRLITFLKKILI